MYALHILIHVVYLDVWRLLVCCICRILLSLTYCMEFLKLKNIDIMNNPTLENIKD